jgi:predicted NAD/FAD-binding protein
MLGDILRFNRRAAADLAAGRLAGLSLGDCLAGGGYSARFRDDYLLAMGAAIWSTTPARMLEFPAQAFVAFCDNHRLLHLSRPVWRTVDGGSRTYVERMTAAFRGRLRLRTPVRRIERDAAGVLVRDETGAVERFDHVVLACRPDRALGLLADPHPDEAMVLGAIRFAENDVWLHRDRSLMPRRRAAWSSWNVLKGSGPTAAASCTYWMNAIQGIDPSRPLFVSLNPATPPRDRLVFGRYAYAHPRYDAAAIAAQARLPGIQGARRAWFCGAWTGHGFHECGLRSGLDAAESLGAAIPWRAARLALAAE